MEDGLSVARLHAGATGGGGGGGAGMVRCCDDEAEMDHDRVKRSTRQAGQEQ